MSSISIKRIKQVSKKTSSGFTNPIPFGTDGLLVDMLSGLDLEEELKLGNNHSATIIQYQNNTTEIEEKYKNNEGSIEFSVLTLITEGNNGTTVNMKLFKGTINRDEQNNVIESNLLHTKITTISNEVIDTEKKTHTTQIEQGVN